MKAILALCALAIAVVLAVQLSTPLAERIEDSNAHARTLAALQAEREAFDLGQHEQFQVATQPGQITSDYMFRALSAIAAAGLLYLVYDLYRARQRRVDDDRRLVYPNQAGYLPAPRAALERGELVGLLADALKMNGIATIEAARNTGVPASLNYSPRVEQIADVGPAAVLPETIMPAALSLPDVAMLSDILPTVPAGRLCYGLLPGGEPLIMNFGQAYHALAAGDTRTGKSNYLDSIITQLHHQSAHFDLRLLIGDFKREMAATWRRSALVETVETDPATIADMLIELAHGPDGILQRYSAFERLGNEHQRVVRNIGDYRKVTGEKPRLTFMVIDELNALIEAADKKDELASALKVVLQTGAGAGVYVLGGAQYLTARVFGRDGSKQFTTRALFGSHDQTASGMVFGAGKIIPETRQLLTGQPGRGLIRTAGQAQPTAFQALRCDEGDILEAVRLITDDQPTIAIPATLQQPSNAAATATTDCQQSPELAEITQRLRTQGMGKTKIIEVLWGVKAGSNERYKVASALYDQIVAEQAQRAA